MIKICVGECHELSTVPGNKFEKTDFIEKRGSELTFGIGKR